MGEGRGGEEEEATEEEAGEEDEAGGGGEEGGERRSMRRHDWGGDWLESLWPCVWKGGCVRRLALSLPMRHTHKTARTGTYGASNY